MPTPEDLFDGPIPPLSIATVLTEISRLADEMKTLSDYVHEMGQHYRRQEYELRRMEANIQELLRREGVVRYPEPTKIYFNTSTHDTNTDLPLSAIQRIVTSKRQSKRR